MAEAGTDLDGSTYGASSISGLKTTVAAISGTAYTAARMSCMTRNDLVYAAKLGAVGQSRQWVNPY